MSKFFSFLFCLGILCSAAKLTAQQKVAYIDSHELLVSMPETKTAEAEFNKRVEIITARYNENVKEYNEKDSLFKRDSSKWTLAIKEIKKMELEYLKLKIQAQLDSWDSGTEFQNERLMEPIKKRALEAIEAVVKENGYTKWIDKSEAAKYPGAKDIMPLVKKKLASTQNIFAEMEFDNEDHYMGIIDEKKVSYDFKFTNTGTAPLIISDVSAKCFCVELQWPQKPIKPGEAGVIKVTYNGVGRPGHFFQSITIVSNARKSRPSLSITGDVGTYFQNKLSEQFIKIMLAFPGNFESLKGSVSNAAISEYNSTVSIETSRKTAVGKGKEDKNRVTSLIRSFDSRQKCLQEYQEWIKTISSITLNGAALKIYKTEETATFVSTKWRIDNSKNNISKEYQQFTIEVSCILLDEKNNGLFVGFDSD
jgi:Skp family chaperone for outer membrane proteins